MKTIQVILFVLFASNLHAQINEKHNRIRVGDEIVKQQMESTDPGGAGKNVTWDFSKLKTINEEYILEYTYPPKENGQYIMGYDSINTEDVHEDELIVGIEHYTMYYFRLNNNVLYQLGHENPVSKFQYKTPIPIISFPTNFGEEVSSEYTAWGVYSNDTIETNGTVTIIADSYGKIKVPNGEIYDTALRVKTTQIITEVVEGNLIIKSLEKYNWYIKGYRYPIFEIVKNINTEGSLELFSTTFFYPPQDHYYLDSDVDNLALLENLWDWNNLDNSIILYPNPVKSLLEIEYKIDQKSPTEIQIYSTNGVVLWKSNKKILEVGTYKENIDCSKYMNGVYIVKVITNYGVETKTLIKN